MHRSIKIAINTNQPKIRTATYLILYNEKYVLESTPISDLLYKSSYFLSVFLFFIF